MNTDLALSVVAHVRMFPEEHNQGTYGGTGSCGTVACLAGHTLLLSGYDLRLNTFYRPDGTVVVEEDTEAAHLLGMSYRDANRVFFCFEREEAIRRLESFAKGGFG